MIQSSKYWVALRNNAVWIRTYFSNALSHFKNNVDSVHMDEEEVGFTQDK